MITCLVKGIDIQHSLMQITENLIRMHIPDTFRLKYIRLHKYEHTRNDNGITLSNLFFFFFWDKGNYSFMDLTQNQIPLICYLG
uniref:Putative ovule protein n=1 Tax=Solanum chacoense TaxID=4108 RepID=A0A0V0HY82_SOLCH